LFIGKTQEVWCSVLNISCEEKTRRSKETVISPAAYVWFDNEKRKVKENLLFDKISTEKQPCPSVNEFVWFEDSNKEFKDIVESLTDDGIESDLDKLLKKVMESSSNILI
jgi:hypothetical protein